MFIFLAFYFPFISIYIGRAGSPAARHYYYAAGVPVTLGLFAIWEKGWSPAGGMNLYRNTLRPISISHWQNPGVKAPPCSLFTDNAFI